MCLCAVCSSYKHLTKRRYSLGQQVLFILYYKCCHNFHKLLITMSLAYLQDRCCLPHYYPTTHLPLHVVPISVTTSPPGYKAIHFTGVHPYIAMCCYDKLISASEQPGYSVVVHSTVTLPWSLWPSLLLNS